MSADIDNSQGIVNVFYCLTAEDCAEAVNIETDRNR